MKNHFDPSDYEIGIDSIYSQGTGVFKEIFLNTDDHVALFEDLANINCDIIKSNIRSRFLLGLDMPEPLEVFDTRRGCLHDISGYISPAVDIDINNICEKVSSFINNKNITGSISSVYKDKKFNIKLKDEQNREQEFDLIPDENGKVLLLDNIAYFYKDSKLSAYNISPDANLDRLISKYVYYNNCMIVRDYSVPQVFSYSYDLKDINLKVNYETVKDKIYINKNRYYLYPRNIVKDVEIYEDGHKCKYSLSYNYLHSNFFLNQNIIYDKEFDKSNRCVSYNDSMLKDDSGNVTIIYNAIYPVSYVNILGFIFMDDDKYRIYCSDSSFIKEGLGLVKRISTYYKVPRDKEEEFFKAMN